jgi:hypothetical protein
LIVLPDWPSVDEETAGLLLKYAENGGKLLIAGAASARAVSARLDLAAGGEPREQPAYLGGGEVLGNARGLWLDVDAGSWQVLEQRFGVMDSTKDGRPAALARVWGRGRIVVVPGPLGQVYAGTHAPAIRDFVRRIVGPRFKPLVEVQGPPTIEVALRRKDGRLLVHLLNCTGMQVAGEWAAIDFVPSVGPVSLRFAGPAPRRVELLPEGRVLRAPYVVDRLGVHAVVAVQSSR